jgi:hypothetical protein
VSFVLSDTFILLIIILAFQLKELPLELGRGTRHGRRKGQKESVHDQSTYLHVWKRHNETYYFVYLTCVNNYNNKINKN